MDFLLALKINFATPDNNLPTQFVSPVCALVNLPNLTNQTPLYDAFHGALVVTSLTPIVQQVKQINTEVINGKKELRSTGFYNGSSVSVFGAGSVDTMRVNLTTQTQLMIALETNDTAPVVVYCRPPDTIPTFDQGNLTPLWPIYSSTRAATIPLNIGVKTLSVIEVTGQPIDKPALTNEVEKSGI
jgi:hypothetical protein